MILQVDDDPKTLIEICPFVYILQSICQDASKMEEKFKKNDTKFDVYFRNHIENVLSLIMNLTYKNTDQKLKERLKYWTTTFDFSHTLFWILDKLFKDKNDEANKVLLQRSLIVLSKLDNLSNEKCQHYFKLTFPFILNLFNEKGRQSGLMDEAIRYLAATFSSSDSNHIMFLKDLLNKIAINSEPFKNMLIEIVSSDQHNLTRYVNTTTLCGYFLEI